ncbi:cell division protein FtsQ/DivIB [Corynebacterium choanae]|uniref:Cell division protein FtsQ n=1 Tax=Corynebacterium choanae TaxID=1862358 RepID=A0A3G6J7I1_9CORY|nr:FtsQ-type POTRA domain-containing protein [Corynebacterium choanae]AZA13946.1 Cell division protein FtsQ [Corynebacterium choanae]
MESQSTRPARSVGPVKRRIIIGVTAVFGIAVLAGAFLWLVPIFTVDNYRVEGAEHTSDDEVIAAAGIPLGTNLLRANLPESSAAVATLPWVKQATVARDFPHTVAIDVVERNAVFAADFADGTHLIDGDGEPFVIADAPPGVVLIDGLAEDNPTAYRTAARFLSQLAPEVRGQVQRIHFASDQFMEVTTTGDRVIVVGSADNLPAKAQTFAVVLQMEGARIDITNPRQVAVAP